MGKKRKKGQKGSRYGLKPLILFALVVLFLFLLSLIVKTAALIKVSKFDSSHSFYLEIDKSYNLSDGFEIIGFAPDRGSVSVLDVRAKKGLPPLQSAPQSVGIPIDARIIFKSRNDYLNFSQNPKIDSRMFYLLSHRNYEALGITPIDLFRLWIYTLGVKADNTAFKRIKLPLAREKLDQLVSLMFADYSLSLKKESIEIINDTNISGLAARLARVIINIGADVVMVSSQTANSASSISYFGKRTYTVDRLHALFGYKLIKMPKPGIADIIINIGASGIHNF